MVSSDQLGIVILWNLFPKQTKEEKKAEEPIKNYDKIYNEKNAKIDDVEISKDPETVLLLCNGKIMKLIKDKQLKLELESEDSIGKIIVTLNQK